jgi:DNA-binding GntR family transcriptional regulator
MTKILPLRPEPAPHPSGVPDPTLRAQAQVILRSAILDGRYEAGQKLGERELSELTGASRSILREALVHLEASGLIERESYKGFRVARLRSRTVCDIFELRASLEVQAAELFCERASDAELLTLDRAFSRVEACLTDFDLARMRTAKEAYFEVIFTGCRNLEIRRALSIAIDRVHFLRSRLIADPDRRQKSIPEIRRLTDALVARDRLEARAATLAHLQSARDAVLELLRKDAEKLPPGGRGHGQ